MWFYACLLLLCPSSFRNEYGPEMTAIFARRLSRASAPGRLFLWLEAISDVILAAAAAHAELLRHDLKYTVRSAARAKAFTAAVIGVAALGVAAATAVFSIADHVLLRPLPFPRPERLVSLWEDQTSRGYSRNQVSPPNFRDWQRMNASFERMAAHRELPLNMSGVGEPERLSGAAATAAMFPALGVEPLLGRTFTEEEDRAGAPGVVVLSHSLWQRRFGGDPAVLGRRLQLDDEAFTVIGVMPADFHFPRRQSELWTAMRFNEEDFSERDNNFLGVIARLRPGVTLDQASAEMRVIAGALEKQYPRDNEKTGVRILRLRDELSWRTRTTLSVLAAAAFFLLLIACSNLANLLLAKASSRAKEMALRAALGAGRERLVRQLLTESALLAGLGGAVGTALAAAAVPPLLSRLVPSTLPIAGTPAMDWRMLAFAFAVTLLTGMAVGVAPALRSAAGALGVRTAGGWRRQRLRRALVVTQVAASLALAISTGLLARALLRVERVAPGFATANRLVFRTSLPMPKYLDTAPRERYYARVLAELRSLPGVRAAGATSFRPMGDFRGGIWGILLPGETRPRRAAARFVTPGYFSAMGIPLLHGRDIGEADSARTLRVAVVSESFVKEHWPGENGLGRTFAIPYGRMTFTIVGVAADVRFRGIEPLSEAQMYFAHAQTPDKSFVWFTPKDFVVAASGDPLALMPAIRRIVAAADPLQPVSDVQTLEGLVADETAPRRVQLWVIGVFAAAAFLLAAIGIHGLLSFAVSQRTGEIGVRIALGAGTRQIAGMVAAEALALAGVGCLLGIAAAWWAGSAMQAFLAGVAPADAATLAGFVGLAVLMTVCGALAPVWRAVRVDPVIALRGE